MFFYNNFLSEQTQKPLLILAVLSWEYTRRGEGLGKKEIVELTGFSDGLVNNHINCLLSLGLVVSRKRKLYPGGKLNSTSLYDLIDYTDGWVHLGNANTESIPENAAARIFIMGCECRIRKGIYDYLQSIQLSSLLPARDEAAGQDSPALGATKSSVSARKARMEPGACLYESGCGKWSLRAPAIARDQHTTAK